jgi:hypothetical protein
MSSHSISPDPRDNLRCAKNQLRLAVRSYGFRRLMREPDLRRRIIDECVRAHQLGKTSLERHFRLFAASALLGREKFFL